MTLKDILETASAVILSLGGGGGIVLGLSSYIGKRWADKALERQKHEYSQLNIAFQSQLDMASRRLQVELDALGLVHKLRTQEEFTRLAELWKRIADLRNTFVAIEIRGIALSYGDAQQRQQYEERAREQFDLNVNEATKYLAQEALFIPKHICGIAESAINAAVQEQLNHANFAPFLLQNTVPSSNPILGDDEVKIHERYFRTRTETFKKFKELTERLEELMRAHIAGQEAEAKRTGSLE
jgi:hypothetical protein